VKKLNLFAQFPIEQLIETHMLLTVAEV